MHLRLIDVSRVNGNQYVHFEDGEDLGDDCLARMKRAKDGN